MDKFDIILSMNKDLKIIFLGTPEFAAIILEKMINFDYAPITVITTLDKPIGRKQVLTPSPVKCLAEKNKIPTWQTDKVTEIKSKILNLNPDLIVLAAFGQIIPKEILEIPKFGCLNIHPSLLPKYRGASPIQATLLNGDQETGVSIMLMDELLDHGPIIANHKLLINENENTETLTKKLAEIGANLLINTLPAWLKGEIKAQTQDHAQATFTKIINKEDGKINWQKPAQEIERLIRACAKWPGVFTEFKIKNTEEKKLKIIKAKIIKIEIKKEPGTVFLTEKKELAVAAGQDALILEDLQLEGKKIMDAQSFLNGYPQIVNSVLF